MAKFVAFQGVNMMKLGPLGLLADPDAFKIANPTSFGYDIKINVTDVEVRGSGFYYTYFFDRPSPTAGTVDSLTVSFGAEGEEKVTEQYQISDLNIPIRDVIDALDGGSVKKLAGVLFSGDDTIEGSKFEDKLHGFDGNDTVNGHNKADKLFGDAGSDTLDGGKGKDILDGGAGDDNFVFRNHPGSGSGDKVKDFGDGNDTLHLGLSGFPLLGQKGALTDGYFVNAAEAQDADDYLIYDSATGRLFYDSDGNGLGAKLAIATLSKGLVLDETDFLVI